MDDLRLVGIGASAGGVEALMPLVSGLEADLDAVVLIVVHQAQGVPSVLANLLAPRCSLGVTAAQHGERLAPGRVLVAPPDAHVHVVGGRVCLDRGPKENGHRPWIDPLFRSLALEAGPRATGVVLSGLLDDGAAGLLHIVRHGGTAVVQDPADARFDAMPTAALEQVPGAVVCRAEEMGAVLEEITARHLLEPHRPSPRLADEERDPPGAPAGLSCPDCDRPLDDLGTGGHARYRCRVGHAWSPQSLRAEHDDAVERALSTALRALEDKASLSHRVAASADAGGAAHVADLSRRSAQDALGSARVLRRLLSGPGPGDGEGRRLRDEHGSAR